MKLTAKDFNNNPAAAYRAADKGEEVTITHDRFEGDFVLVSNNLTRDALSEVEYQPTPEQIVNRRRKYSDVVNKLSPKIILE